MKDSPGALELLSERVDELERRVRALEHPPEVASGTQSAERKPAAAPAHASLLETGSIFPLIGRALLGIAGAYVLRAIAESGVLPKLAVSAVAVAYAFGWLVWSASASSKLARIVYAGTSALILAPMLWENTLAFHVFTSMATAGVFAAFMTLATVLESRDGGMWVAQTSAVLTAALLGFTTLHGLPFVTALLVAVFASEFARTRELPQPVWPVMVLVADGAVWGLIFIYSGPQETRAVYPELSAIALIAPACILFAINGGSVSVRVVGRGCRITIFEVIQVVIAFALAVAALLTFDPVHGKLILGIACLLLSAGTYTYGFMFLARRGEQPGFRVFAAWSAVLVVMGSASALPQDGAAALLACTAVAAMYFAVRMKSLMLELHGAIFLLCGGVLAGRPRFFFQALAGSQPAAPRAGVVLLSICAAIAVALGGFSEHGVGGRIVHTTVALVAVCGAAGLLVRGVVAAVGTLIGLEAHHVASLVTVTLCAVALGVAFGGSRWQRPALTHLAYAALVVVGVKLFGEDLRLGHMGFAAASIAVIAVTLMCVPRLVRVGARRRAQAEADSQRRPASHAQV